MCQPKYQAGTSGLVDRGALTPNEWRDTFNLSPVADGDKPLRRLDTETVGTIRGLLSEMTLENAVEIKEKIMGFLKGGEEDESH